LRHRALQGPQSSSLWSMKETLTDANFPRTADGRVYHLGVRVGEVANRIITVGPPSRARNIASLLSPNPTPFVLGSERGFLTITGLYKGVPVTICAIGMGASNADFFVRETRECVTGDMVIVRLGSCGGLLTTLTVGSVVVPKASVSVRRNYDFDFTSPAQPHEEAYHISKPVAADPALQAAILKRLHQYRLNESNIVINGNIVNASADSFYSSQGRQTSFPDHNEHLIEYMLKRVESLASLEMETFHILHLAKSWSPSDPDAAAPITSESSNPLDSPISDLPTAYTLTEKQPSATPTAGPRTRPSKICAASVQMIFAARQSRDFITPEVVLETEAWTSEAVLEALVHFEILPERTHPNEGSVWEIR